MSTFYYPVGAVAEDTLPQRNVQKKSLAIAFGLDASPGERPLLDELGVDFGNIRRRVSSRYALIRCRLSSL